ncbi:hypothetical protein QJS04_geneDACA011982 [Acorus gramineus]|uniref:Uncharacterized protein n=1 Tax=Acorus gramineus TaxID=55184 RepID=A0AAV9AHQ2_ACOGR|nr:hypothetical protein QJS04_geneDACA011982 [Acorus gramineus]
MEVMVPMVSDFNFDSSSACSTPFISAPSSPKRSDFFYFSTPTSPSRSSSAVATHAAAASSDADDFAFDFSGHLDISAADELFEAGRIRPLKPPPRLQNINAADHFSPRSPSPRSPMEKGRRIFREAFSPRKSAAAEVDPFEAAIENARRSRREAPAKPGRRSARSMSPLRVSDFGWDDESAAQKQSRPSVPKAASRSKKWRFRDLLLFRSASEGSSTAGYVRRYCGPWPSDAKSSSFRSTDGGSTGSSRRGLVSAHEMHYTANRAVSEELKKKTALPYKQGLLGCLGFNPAVHGFTRGFTRGRS